MPLSAIVPSWAELNAIRMQHDDRDRWFRPEWIPLADNGAADNIVVDSVTGRAGYFVHDDPDLWEDEPSLFERFSSFAALLEAMADSIEQGSPVGWETPEIVEGQLRWRIDVPIP